MKLTRFKDEYIFLIPSLAVNRHGFAFGWLVWHWGKVWSHDELITCPACKKEVTSTVDHTWPFYSYVHFCECGYTITESEWEMVKK